MSKAFWDKYYGDLVGATVLSFDGMKDEEMCLGAFPTFTVKFKSGEIGQISISQDEEGNGGGFIFGLALPQEVDA